MSFIVLEGIDGCGKSTQANILAQTIIKRHRHTVWLTSEPSNGPIGRFIRNKVLPGRHELNEHSISHLFVADRIDHVRSEIKPALDRGEVVVCDRFLPTTVAYQSTGQTGISFNRAVLLHEGIRAPDLTLYLQLPPSAAERRLSGRQGPAEMYEHLERLRQISAVYDSMVHTSLTNLPERVRQILDAQNIVVINADGSTDEVASRIYQAVVVRGLLEC